MQGMNTEHMYRHETSPALLPAPSSGYLPLRSAVKDDASGPLRGP